MRLTYRSVTASLFAIAEVDGAAPVEDLDDLGKVGERAGQAVHFADDDGIDLASLDVGEQLLQRRPLQGSARDAAVVIVGSDRMPALAGLTLDVGLAGLALGVERVERLVEPLLGRFAGVDRAAQALGPISGHGSMPPAGRPCAAQRTAARTSGCR